MVRLGEPADLFNWDEYTVCDSSRGQSPRGYQVIDSADADGKHFCRHLAAHEQLGFRRNNTRGGWFWRRVPFLSSMGVEGWRDLLCQLVSGSRFARGIRLRPRSLACTFILITGIYEEGQHKLHGIAREDRSRGTTWGKGIRSQETPRGFCMLDSNA